LRQAHRQQALLEGVGMLEAINIVASIRKPAALV
jgi:hypothetical protein